MPSNKFFFTSLLLLSYLLITSSDSPANADELPILDEIIITSEYTERFLNSTVSDIKVLTSDDISMLGVHSITEILETIASVNLIERGTPGSQSDVTIRGSSTEGVLVLVNGICVNDPQTGHFTMDIPVNLSSVERIEVMSGGNSSIYGSPTTGGVINIVTKKDSDGFYGGVSIGSYRSGSINTTYTKQFSATNISITMNGGKSDGYNKSSELEYTGMGVTGSFKSNLWSATWNIGIINKSFGAGDFYAPYPSSEKTLTVQGGLNVTRLINDRKIIRLRIGSRGHGDDFTLIENKPEFYRNTHYNRSYNVSAEYLFNIYKNILLLTGAETQQMGITSGSLGLHSDYNNAVYSELSLKMKKIDLSASIRFDSNSRKENIFSPGFGFVVPVSNKSRFKIYAEKSFRSPTYTELYYRDPANIGSPYLKTEHSSNINAGFDVTGKNHEFGISLFTRKSTNVIDWVRNSGENNDPVWNAANHGRIITNGMEIKFNFTILENWKNSFNTVMLTQSVERKKGVKSKYSLNPLDKTFTATITGPLFKNIQCALITRLEQQLHGESRTPVTLEILRNLGAYKTVFSVRNVFNERYEEISGLQAPGRWLNLSMEYSK